jgi:acetyltransferase-like isoleucine patch superfamily enzyme
MAGVESKQLRSSEADYSAPSLVMSIIDPRAWAHLLRVVHYNNYANVRLRRRADIAHGVRMAPNVSLMNPERIKIGPYSYIGARCSLWAGNSRGRVMIGHHALLGPEVFIAAGNCRLEHETPVMDQSMYEGDVVIGDDVLLGARAMVVAGVEIGNGSVVAADSVVTRSIPPGSIAGGSPARIIGRRGDQRAEAEVRKVDILFRASEAG